MSDRRRVSSSTRDEVSASDHFEDRRTTSPRQVRIDPPANVAGPSDRETAQSRSNALKDELIFSLANQLRLERAEHRTGAVPLALGIKVVSLIAKLYDAAQQIIVSRQSLPTFMSTHAASPLGKQLLEDCANVAVLQIDGAMPEGTGKYTKLRLDAFPTVRCLSISNCTVDYASGVERIARLQLSNTRLADGTLRAFSTVRHIAMGLTDIDSANLGGTCYSLRSLRVTVEEEHATKAAAAQRGGAPAAPSISWAPSRQHLRAFEVVPHDLVHWECLTHLEFRGAKRVSKMAHVRRLLSCNASWQYLSQLVQLSLVNLRLPNLEGFEPLSQCEHLRTLDLSDNVLTTLEPSYALPTNIKTLNLQHNLLMGDVLKQLDRQTKLTSLNISDNELCAWNDVMRLATHKELRSLQLTHNPVQTASDAFFRSDDELMSFLVMVVLPQCTALASINGIATTKEHRMAPRELIERLSRIVDDVQGQAKATHRHRRKEGGDRADARPLRSALKSESSGAQAAAPPRAPSTRASVVLEANASSGPRASTATSRRDTAASDVFSDASATVDDAPSATGGAKRPRPKGKRRAKAVQLNDQREYAEPPQASGTGVITNASTKQVLNPQLLRQRFGESYLVHLPVVVDEAAKQAAEAQQRAARPAAKAAAAARKQREDDASDSDSYPIVNNVNTVALDAPRGAQWAPSTTRMPLLLERFVATLKSHEWHVPTSVGRKKAFPAGVVHDDTQIGDENRAMWEVGPTCVPHPTSREILFRDAKEPQPQDATRFSGRTLIRVVETHVSCTRYVRVEVKAKAGSFGGQRPATVVALSTPAQTPLLDVEVRAPSTAVESAGQPRARASTLVGDGVVQELAADVVGHSGRCVHAMETRTLLVGFVVQSGPIADELVRLVCQQVRACHSALCSNGIVYEWPLHLDSAVRGSSVDLDHAVPITGPAQLFYDQLRTHSDEDATRQRHGAEAIFDKDDELRLALQTYIFENPAADAYTSCIYADVRVATNARPSSVVMNPASGVKPTSCILATTGTTLFIAEDRNYAAAHPGRRYVDPQDTFAALHDMPLEEINRITVSFDAQHFALRFEDITVYVSTFDRSATLSVMAALAELGIVTLDAAPNAAAARQQAIRAAAAKRAPGAKISVKHDETDSGNAVTLVVAPCPYPFLTTAPLVFAVTAYLRVSSARGVARHVFPVRHLEESLALRMVPVSIVATASELCAVRLEDALATDVRPPFDNHCTVLQRASISELKAVEVASCDRVFPLVFSALFETAGRQDRWLLCAPHPNCIAQVVKEMRRTNPRVAVDDLEYAAYRSVVDASASALSNPVLEVL